VYERLLNNNRSYTCANDKNHLSSKRGIPKTTSHILNSFIRLTLRHQERPHFHCFVSSYLCLPPSTMLICPFCLFFFPIIITFPIVILLIIFAEPVHHILLSDKYLPALTAFCRFCLFLFFLKCYHSHIRVSYKG
jgi:hypothetical protein